MEFTSKVLSIDDIFDSSAIINLVEQTVDDLPKCETDFVLDINMWDCGITNKQYAQVLMLKNKIKSLEIRTDMSKEKYVVVHYTNDTCKTFFVKKEIYKGYEYYSVDDNYIKDLNKILYYYNKE